MGGSHVMEFATTIRSETVYNYFYKSIGAGILVFNKLRYSLRGYLTPRTFPITDYRKAVEYDIRQVENCLFYLSRYLNRDFSVRNKNILELGPGADLGVGLYLLFKGASQYNALDANNLVESVPPDFYNYFLSRLQELAPSSKVTLDFLRSQLELTRQKNNDLLNYICRQDFSLSVFKKRSFDLVMSLAVFEHLKNVEDTVSQLSEVIKSGGILIAVIDLRTHSRWIRDKDPLNIYRYSDSFYDLCKFRGSPNRLRPYQYEEILRENGWKNIWIKPVKVSDEKYLVRVHDSLDKIFRDEKNQMGYLSIVLCATKH
jgi:SAM-dependent methyltransferase